MKTLLIEDFRKGVKSYLHDTSIKMEEMRIMTTQVASLIFRSLTGDPYYSTWLTWACDRWESLDITIGKLTPVICSTETGLQMHNMSFLEKASYQYDKVYKKGSKFLELITPENFASIQVAVSMHFISILRTGCGERLEAACKFVRLEDGSYNDYAHSFRRSYLQLTKEACTTKRKLAEATKEIEMLVGDREFLENRLRSVEVEKVGHQLYLQRLTSPHVRCLKIGISKDTLKRIKQQRKDTQFKHELVGVWEFSDAKQSRSCEDKIKRSFRSGVIEKSWMPDGYTETLDAADENLIVNTITTYARSVGATRIIG